MPVAGAPSDNTTMVEVLRAFSDAGYDSDFTITTGAALACPECEARTPDVAMDEMRRLEGASDPADMAAVLALRCEVCGTRGTTVVRFGPEASRAEAELLDRLDDQRDPHAIEEG